MSLTEVPGYLEGSKKRVEDVTTAKTKLLIAENPEHSQDRDEKLSSTSSYCNKTHFCEPLSVSFQKDKTLF